VVNEALPPPVWHASCRAVSPVLRRDDDADR
jgi:hypothetical protein